MGKYSPLKERLISDERKGKIEVPMSFGEIEAIIDDELPISAYSYRPWWTNSRNTEISGAKNGWIAANWQVKSVDLTQKTVVFRRAT